MNKKPKVLLIPEKLSEELAKLSEDLGISQSEIVRTALFEFFSKKMRGGGNNA
ncbi:MAG: CopG family transcriptional regulator [Candidatus Nanoarchaeia archaeon]|nr:ribbon-helix-helix domain-containing protein [Candidatus Jingweiarchaeum tengchongense]